MRKKNHCMFLYFHYKDMVWDTLIYNFGTIFEPLILKVKATFYNVISSTIELHEINSLIF